MARVVSFRVNGSSVQEALSKELNIQRKALDNEWLHEQVQLGRLTQDALLQLHIIKDRCELVYPGNWDLQVQVIHKTVEVDVENDIQFTANDMPYGCYFEFEDFDTEQYYLWDWDGPPRRQERIRLDPLVYLKFEIIVRFPELLVKNSKRQSTVVKDLFYRIDFQTDVSSIKFQDSGLCTNDRFQNITRRTITDGAVQTLTSTRPGITLDYCLGSYYINTSIYAYRSTLYYSQFKASYAQSHTHSRRSVSDYMNWGGCCLGSGEITNTLASIRSAFNADVFQLLLFQLETYGSWESLEGGPYVNLTSISRGGIVEPSPMASQQSYYNSLLRFVKAKRETFEGDVILTLNAAQIEYYYKDTNFDWTIDTQGFLRVVANEKFERFCKIYSVSGLYNTHQVYKKDVAGNYYAINTAESPRDVSNVVTVGDIERSVKIFRGEEVRFVLLPDENIAEIQDDFFLNPILLEFIKTKLENHANQQKIKSDSTKRAISFANNPRNF